jgi:hypothetical protein
MSLKLEEFRKRLLQQPGNEDSVSSPVELSPEEAVVEPLPLKAPSAPSEAQRATDLMAAAVSKVFAQSSALQSRADEFAAAVESIERLSKAVTRAFGPLRAFYNQLAEVSGSFESLRLFQAQLASLSPTFEPMKLLHDQVAQLTGTIEVELGQVVKALDPAKDLSDRVSLLSRSLRQANELQSDFADLYAAFQGANRSSAAQAVQEEAQPSLH